MATPGNPLKKVLPGQALDAVPREAYNALIDIIGERVGSIFSGGDGVPKSDTFGTSIVRIQNNTGGDLATNSVVGVGFSNVPIAATDNLGEYKSRSLFYGTAPSATATIAITIEPIADGEIGKAVISGVAPVQVYVSSSTHTRAVATAETDYLTSAESGPIAIIQRNAPISYPGTVWAYVMLTGPIVLPDVLHARTTTSGTGESGYYHWEEVRYNPDTGSWGVMPDGRTSLTTSRAMEISPYINDTVPIGAIITIFFVQTTYGTKRPYFVYPGIRINPATGSSGLTLGPQDHVRDSVNYLWLDRDTGIRARTIVEAGDHTDKAFIDLLPAEEAQWGVVTDDAQTWQGHKFFKNEVIFGDPIIFSNAHEGPARTGSIRIDAGKGSGTSFSIVCDVRAGNGDVLLTPLSLINDSDAGTMNFVLSQDGSQFSSGHGTFMLQLRGSEGDVSRLFIDGRQGVTAGGFYCGLYVDPSGGGLLSSTFLQSLVSNMLLMGS